MLGSILDALTGYWTPQELAANCTAILNILGALILGLIVGYERSYRGRAAGMRTYGLVCMASCSLTVIGGYPEYWYGAHTALDADSVGVTRIIQGIISGIGFLGAGVIMRDGMNISGLTTAASIWVVASIGIIVGIGFYGTAIIMAIVSAVFMMWGFKIESLFPSRHAISITLHFQKDTVMTEEYVSGLVHEMGYEIAHGSFSIDHTEGQAIWRFVAVSYGRGRGTPLIKLAEAFRTAKGIQNFHLAHARN